MSVLFVDVDGTLITEDPETGMDVTREDVIMAVQKHHREFNRLRGTIIWSGGGIDYAETWARRLFPDMDIGVLAKDRLTPRLGDVVVDDMLEFRVQPRVLLLTPEEFVGWANGEPIERYTRGDGA